MTRLHIVRQTKSRQSDHSPRVALHLHPLHWVCLCEALPFSGSTAVRPRYSSARLRRRRVRAAPPPPLTPPNGCAGRTPTSSKTGKQRSSEYSSSSRHLQRTRARGRTLGSRLTLRGLAMMQRGTFGRSVQTHGPELRKAPQIHAGGTCSSIGRRLSCSALT